LIIKIIKHDPFHRFDFFCANWIIFLKRDVPVYQPGIEELFYDMDCKAQVPLGFNLLTDPLHISGGSGGRGKLHR
jgi:hypothetical protein